MKVFFWIWGKRISPVVMFFGGLYYLACFLRDGNGDTLIDFEKWVLYVGAGLALIGLVIGFIGWEEDVPRRWRWTKSKVDLLDTRIGTASDFAGSFFLTPAAISLIIKLVNYFIQNIN